MAKKGFSIRIEIVEDNITVTKAELNKAIKAGLTECGLNMERYAKQLCPVGDPAKWKWPAPKGYVGGTLRNSIASALDGQIPKAEGSRTYKVEGKGRKAKGKYSEQTPKEESGHAVYIGTNVEYAPYVEFGTSKMKARKFIQPALVDHKDEHKKTLEKHLENTGAIIR